MFHNTHIKLRVEVELAELEADFTEEQELLEYNALNELKDLPLSCCLI